MTAGAVATNEEGTVAECSSPQPATADQSADYDLEGPGGDASCCVGLPTVRLAPFQPRNIKFPTKEITGKKRAFRSEWFNSHPWLEWDSEAEAAFCHPCRMARQLNLILFARCGEDAFTHAGFTNWKHALVKFNSHENSAVHKEAVMKWNSYSSNASIASQLVCQTEQEQKRNREALLQLFSSLLYLARQGLATRGHTDEASNYHQLLQLRATDSEALNSLLNSSRRHKWLSHEIESKMIEHMSHTLLRQLTDEIRQDGYYAIIVDETTDIATREQVSMCVRHVDDNWNISEDFVGMYATDRTDAGTLTRIVSDVLLRLNLDVCNLRAQCYDGASNMAGVHSGVQKRIRDLQPKAVYIHCHNHLLNLAVQEAASYSVRCVRDILSLVNDLANFFRESAKRSGILECVTSDVCGSGTDTKLQPLCPTRWVVRARALNALLQHYEAVIKALDKLSDEPGPTGAKAEGFCSKLMSFDCLLYLKISQRVFSIVEQLASSLQKKTMTLSDARENVSNVVSSLKSMRCESHFTDIWGDVTRLADNLNLPKPELPRRRKLPRRIDDGGLAHHYDNPCTYHRVESWYTCIDAVVTQIEERFSGDSFLQIANAEDLLIRAASGQPYKNELTKFLEHYDDFDESSLDAQLTLLRTAVLRRSLPADEKLTVSVVAEILKNAAGAQTLLDQVCRLTKLLLVVPATSATAERSFSALRRLKTYLRATMGQPRLNNLLMLHCHKDRADKLNLKDICQEFVLATDQRSNFFGNYVRC